MQNEMKRESIREKLYILLGELPARTLPISSRLVVREEREEYILEKLVLELNGIEPVPAYFVKPLDSEGVKLPAVLYNHSHGGNYHIGKDEILKGTSYIKEPPYAVELTRAGYCALCVDAWTFGERRGRTESETFKQMLWYGTSMWGMMVYDSLRAIYYLASRPDVCAERIGTLGMSMGSTMAWWTAALDARIKVCVDICCMTDFHELIRSRGLDEHGVYYYVPGLLKHFTTADINALIAPRAHLSLNGVYDRLTPEAGLDKINEELKKVYKNESTADAWKLVKYNTGHVETAAMRTEILAFLKQYL